MESTASAEHTLPPTLEMRLWDMRERGRTSVHSFYTQEMAMVFSKRWGWRAGLLPSEFVKEGEGLRLPTFAYDIDKANGEKGGKKYVVASYETFCRHYAEQVAPRERFYYELLQPGLPAHLYVDAEFTREHNPQADGNWLHEVFCAETRALLLQMGMAAREDQIHILVMDASDAKKWSHHYLVKVDGRCFKSHYHCGAFIKHLCNHLLTKYGKPGNPDLSEDNPCYVTRVKKTVSRVFFCDLGVYTIHRCFRLYGSSKRGAPYRPFLFLDETGPEPLAGNLTLEKMKKTLIQWVTLQEAKGIFPIKNPDGSEPESSSDTRRFRIDAGNLFGPQMRKRLDEGLTGTLELAMIGGGTSRQRLVLCSDASETVLTPENGGELGPLLTARLFAMIRKEWRDPGMQLTIKKFSHRFLTLGLWSGSRNCRILGREHTSNHITFRISLSTMRFYQACFDPEPPCCLALSRQHSLAGCTEEEKERILQQREGYPLDADVLPMLEAFLGKMGKRAEQSALFEMADALHSLNRLVMAEFSVANK